MDAVSENVTRTTGVLSSDLFRSLWLNGERSWLNFPLVNLGVGKQTTIF